MTTPSNAGTVKPEYVKLVEASFGRCCLCKDFFDHFYNVFLGSSSQLKDMFAKTDFDKQKKLLKNSINYVLMYAKDRGGISKSALDKVGVVHDRSHVNIKPNMYPLWTESLMKTIQHFEGPNFTQELNTAWREVIKPAIELLKSMY